MPLARGPVFGLALGSPVAPADSSVPSGLNATDDNAPGGGGAKARGEEPEAAATWRPRGGPAGARGDSGVPSGLNARDDNAPGGGGTKARVEYPEAAATWRPRGVPVR